MLAVRLLLSSHLSEYCLIFVPVFCLLYTKLSVSNKPPYIAAEPDMLYLVVIVRSDELDVLQLSGVKQAAS